MTILQADVDEQGILAPIFGHAGDGNFHALLLFSTPEEQKKIDGLVHRMVERAQRLDGTCTGEHGVGMGKMVSLRRASSPAPRRDKADRLR